MGNKEIKDAAYIVRAYTGPALPREYLNYVLSRWMRGYRFGNDFIKLSDSDHYFNRYSFYIKQLLAKDDCIVRIASLADDFDVLLGFSVTRRHDELLDYVHVHKDYRRQGIGKFLTPPQALAFTHLTRVGMKLWPTKLPDAVFTPFA